MLESVEKALSNESHLIEIRQVTGPGSLQEESIHEANIDAANTGGLEWERLNTEVCLIISVQNPHLEEA